MNPVIDGPSAVTWGANEAARRGEIRLVTSEEEADAEAAAAVPAGGRGRFPTAPEGTAAASTHREMITLTQDEILLAIDTICSWNVCKAPGWYDVLNMIVSITRRLFALDKKVDANLVSGSSCFHLA